MPVPQSRPWLRLPPPLIEPDLRISRIRLSDGIHDRACTGRRVLSGSSRKALRLLLGPAIELLPLTLDYRVLALRQCPVLADFRSAPEPGLRPSTGITRLPRYHEPLLLPRRPEADHFRSPRLVAATHHRHGSPTLPQRPCAHA